jgi:serpin B
MKKMLLVLLCGMPAWAGTDVAQLAQDNNAFALDLFQQLRAAPGNLFFSPYSISTALAMAAGGARGATEQQLAAALHFSLDRQRLHPAFADLQAALNRIQQSGHVKLSIANSLWPHKKHPFLADYLALTKRCYGVAITPLDYEHAADAAAATINRWVEDQTQDKIKNIIPPGTLDTLTRLVLVNAIYFKGNWAQPFQKETTQPAPFTLAAGKTVPAPMMSQSREFRYAEAEGVQLLELPYAGAGLAMLVLLPEQPDGLASLEKGLTADKLHKWTQQLRQREVNVFLPQFKMTAKFELSRALAALGMQDAFGGAADFSGMDGQRDLFIGAILHKAFVDVNEEGTEAAAATAIIMRATAMMEPPPTFRADHPFLFLIRENSTGSILFLGRVADPTQPGG